MSTFALIELVKQAKKSIIIQSPYLITTDLGKKLFEDAVKRGVEIRILTNSIHVIKAIVEKELEVVLKKATNL